MTSLKKRMIFDSEIYTKDSGHFHKDLAEKKAKQLRQKGWLVRIHETKSSYSLLELFGVYKRRKK